MDFEKLNFVAQKFFVDSKIININMINSGLINKTYIVEHLLNGRRSKFVLQSLSNVFESPEIVNSNHKLITDHITKKTTKNFFDNKKWEVPSLIRCKSNNLFGFFFESNYWRAMVCIDEVFSLDCLEDENIAYQTGIGLAKFHLLCSDFDSSKLENSIKNFHDTRYYIDQYFISLNDYDFNQLDDIGVNKRIDYLKKCLSKHFELVDFILTYLSTKIIDQNVIHGDPKLSNFLFDIQKKHVVSLIDLDTVTSGNLLLDLADCIRSISNLAGEDPEADEIVSFDMESCLNFLKGYFSIKSNINDSFRFIPEFIYLITFELTIRFFTDFLQSNKYFKIKYQTHNLYRAEVQYRLLSSFLLQIPVLSNELRAIGIFSSSTFVSDVQKIV